MKFERSARFFGDAEAPLFGVYHSGQGSIVRGCGVLLCSAAPQENSMTYWCVQQLAVALAESGFSTLRFDYFGTGDSAGTSAEVSLARWVDDIESATEELRRLAGVRRICVVGVRLGAALAVRAVSRGLAVRDLVLWDPVVDGASYVALMRTVDERVHRSRHYPVSNVPPVGELFGYPFGAAIDAETCAIDLLHEPLGNARRILVASPREDFLHSAFVQRALSDGVNTAHEMVNDPILYSIDANPIETLFAHHGISSIVAYLNGR